MWKLFAKVIVEPAKQHLAFLLLVGGSVLIFVGAVFGGAIDSVKYVPHGTGDVLTKAGGAILGAGVFAVIMKSAQFTEYFQKNIHDVFFRPDSLDSVESLKHKWVTLTRHLLKDTLPVSHQDATSVILKRFFDNELEFHFEQFYATYEISLAADKKTLNVVHTIKADVVISPRFEEIEIRQTISTNGGLKLTSLLVDNKTVNVDEKIAEMPDRPGCYQFRLKLSPAKSRGLGGQDRRATVERVYEFVQDIEKEPYLMATFERYVKGFVVQAKCHNCNIYFSPTGTIDEPPVSEDQHGNKRWVLADRDTLLLPGEGYIFVVTV